MSLALSSLVALLALEPSLMNDPHPQAIAGGQTVNTCGWPSVVLLRGNGYLCTGNLIHPQIVATAAHCIEVMQPNTQVFFGDTANTAQEKVAVDFCMSSPDFVSTGDGTIPFSEVGNDWGFCKLAAPVTDVEPIPVIYGCEMDLIQPGAEIVRVGFGKETLATNQFFKRWVQTTIVSIPFFGAHGWPTQLSEGGGGQGTCPGDSGGPAFVRVPGPAGDESWRMVAIQSTQPIEDAEGNPIECGTEPNNTAVIAQGVELIENESGIDVTPCFDVQGGWAPSFFCQGFPIDPGQGGGTWSMGCETGPLGGFSGACGIPLDQGNPDNTPMSLLIVDPPGTVVEDFNGEPVAVHVLADADDGPNGWGVARVDLVILDASTNTELGVFEDATFAYEWEPKFPMGAFLIRAIGYDNAGHVTETDTREIYIGVDPPASDDGGTDDTGAAVDETGDEPPPDDTTGAPSGDDANAEPPTGDGTGDLPARGDEDDGGCSCRTGDRIPTPALLLIGLLAFPRRRRA